MAEENDKVRFEPKDINVPVVLWAGLGFFIALLIIVTLVRFPYFFFAHRRAREGATSSGRRTPSEALPPAPNLESSPYRDWRIVQAQWESELKSYEWVDRQKGILTIPIDRAIDLIAQRGIPPSPKPATPMEYYRPQAGDRLTGFEERQEPGP